MKPIKKKSQEVLKTDLSFENLMKKALNTPLPKKSTRNMKKLLDEFIIYLKDNHPLLYIEFKEGLEFHPIEDGTYGLAITIGKEYYDRASKDELINIWNEWKKNNIK